MPTSMTSNIHVSHPPGGKSVHNKAGGTVTHLSSNGPAKFNLYNGNSATGTPIFSANFPGPFSMATNISYTAGLYIQMFTASSVFVSTI